MNPYEDKWLHAGLSPGSWPTITEQRELFAQLRAGWLKPYRDRRRVPLQHTGAKPLSSLGFFLMLQRRRIDISRIPRFHVWTAQERQKALRYLLGVQHVWLERYRDYRETQWAKRVQDAAHYALRPYWPPILFKNLILEEQAHVSGILARANAAIAQAEFWSAWKRSAR